MYRNVRAAGSTISLRMLKRFLREKTVGAVYMNYSLTVKSTILTYKLKSMKTGELNFEEAREALEQLYESSNEQRRFVLRLYVLYAFNDKYGRKGLEFLLDCDDYLYFIENCKEMIKMDQTNSTLRAELYREIGEFDQCVKYLDSLDPVSGYENEVRIKIRERALAEDRMVFAL